MMRTLEHTSPPYSRGKMAGCKTVADRKGNMT